MVHPAPVITFDGPSGCGKGTMAQRVAQELQWHLLDSGSLYRTVAWALDHHHRSENELEGLGEFIVDLDIQFKFNSINEMRLLCEGIDITSEIRTEACGLKASKVAAIPLVRAALLKRQHQFRQLPGLVADGRDMGSVVFPDALIKFYLTASPEERVKRRYNQLKEKGISASLQEIQDELKERDYRDQHREISPLKITAEMIEIDTTSLSIEEVFKQIMQAIKGKLQGLKVSL